MSGRATLTTVMSMISMNVAAQVSHRLHRLRAAAVRSVTVPGRATSSSPLGSFHNSGCEPRSRELGPGLDAGRRLSRPGALGRPGVVDGLGSRAAGGGGRGHDRLGYLVPDEFVAHEQGV